MPGGSRAPWLGVVGLGAGWVGCVIASPGSRRGPRLAAGVVPGTDAGGHGRGVACGVGGSASRGGKHSLMWNQGVGCHIVSTVGWVSGWALARCRAVAGVIQASGEQPVGSLGVATGCRAPPGS
jgi:hypothetical protein